MTRARSAFIVMLMIGWVTAANVMKFDVMNGAAAAENDAKKKEQQYRAEMNVWGEAYEKDVLPILQEQCSDCHQGDGADGEFNLERYDSARRAVRRAHIWKRVGKRVRLNEMPPEGSPGLSDEQKAMVHAWLDAKPELDLCNVLANDETQSWYRGSVMSRRLTRTEYINAVADLVGLPIRDPSLIPSDGAGGEGFDTAGDSLFTSAIHIERYLRIASNLIDELVAPATGNEATGNDSRARQASNAAHRIFVEVPDGEGSDRETASRIIETFARRAWRRPITHEEVERLLNLFDATLDRGADFRIAVGESLKAVLVSPHFLFVVETEAPEGGVQRLTQHQLATRLALFLWSSIPDADLLAAADAGLLDTNEQVIAQTRRMLLDPRSRALGENFGMQWLGLSAFLTSVRPDPEVYPEYNEPLATDLYEEAVRSVWRVFREDRSVLEFIDSPTIEINQSLASHYDLGVEDLSAESNSRQRSDWQIIETEDRRRGGVVSLGAVLMTASYPRRTSPVLRGRWVLEELLGGRVPPPPENVPALEDAAAEQEMTLRERLELHRKNPECASCHNRMDPLGFGLENFDGLGRWREKDGTLDIDASGRLPSGETFQGPEELKQVLLRRSDEFEEHFVKKIAGFALGRRLGRFDDCLIKDCLKALTENDHRSSAVIETIVTSFPFQHRHFKAAKPDEEENDNQEEEQP